MKAYLALLLALVPSALPATALRDMIGQCIIVGFDGTKIEAQPVLKKGIKEHNLGGVILFDLNTRRAIVHDDGSTVPAPRNIESPVQLRALTEALQREAKTPLFIAIDQEGGRIARLHPGNGFPKTISHKTLATLSPQEARQATLESAKVLKEHGINFNFGPVLDLDTPGNFIAAKERCFSPDPQTVIQYAEIYIRSFREEGILCAAKHFPGHGSTQGDSHLGLVDGTATWSAKELTPYKAFIRQGDLQAILTGHIYIKQLDPEHPATLSHKILTDLLRRELGYQGLILTDDLNMGAIEEEYPLPEASVLALLAGNDMILICHTLLEKPEDMETVINAIEDAVHSGRLPQKQIEASYKRILSAKKSVGLFTDPIR